MSVGVMEDYKLRDLRASHTPQCAVSVLRELPVLLSLYPVLSVITREPVLLTESTCFNEEDPPGPKNTRTVEAVDRGCHRVLCDGFFHGLGGHEGNQLEQVETTEIISGSKEH
jgi:hypothetical protein